MILYVSKNSTFSSFAFHCISHDQGTVHFWSHCISVGVTCKFMNKSWKHNIPLARKSKRLALNF